MPRPLADYSCRKAGAQALPNAIVLMPHWTILLLLALAACQSPSGKGATLDALPQDNGWLLELAPMSELPDGTLVFSAQSERLPTEPEAIEEATANALTYAARTRESKIEDMIEVRARQTTELTEIDYQRYSRLNAEAAFRGFRVLEQQVRPGEDGFSARVRVQIQREQVFFTEGLGEILDLAPDQRPDALRRFADEARLRGDADARGLALSFLVDQSRMLEDVLQLVDLVEDQGHLNLARSVASRWRGRIPDPQELLAQRMAHLEALLVDVQELVARLRVSLEGAQRTETRIRASRPVVASSGPRARQNLYGSVRPNYPVSFVWIDSESLGVPSHMALQGSEVSERFEWEVVDWNESDGYRAGPVFLAVLSGLPSDPPPTLDPEVPLHQTSHADRVRLERFVNELQAWIQRSGNQVAIVSWTQQN